MSDDVIGHAHIGQANFHIIDWSKLLSPLFSGISVLLKALR